MNEAEPVATWNSENSGVENSIDVTLPPHAIQTMTVFFLPKQKARDFIPSSNR